MNVKDFSIFVKGLSLYKIASNESIRNKFIEYYTFLFDTPPQCSACPSDIESALFKLRWIMLLQINNGNTELLKAKAMTKYTMLPKVRVMSNSMGIMVTQYNCTDAIAEALIKENPKHIALFTINADVEEGSPIVNVQDVTTSTEKVVEEPKKEFVFEIKDHSKSGKRKRK